MRNKTLLLVAAIAAVPLLGDVAVAQEVIQGYSVQEVNPEGGQPLLFGIASYKLCQVKNFMFSMVYILAAIAFVLFAIMGLFGKFKGERFFPIVGAVFLVASADLVIAWLSPNAFYCPMALTAMGQ